MSVEKLPLNLKWMPSCVAIYVESVKNDYDWMVLSSMAVKVKMVDIL